MRVPALRVYVSHEEDKWYFGTRSIVDKLEHMKLLSMDRVRRDAWAQQGVDLALNEVNPILEHLFRYPKVRSAACV